MNIPAALTAIEHPTLSPKAAALLAWCRATKRPANGRPGPVVSWNWNAVAEVLEAPDVNGRLNWGAIQPVIDELHAAGHLAYHDEGPGTFNHSTTILVEA